PPIYTINLSLPPRQRYVQVTQDYKLILESLTYIFDDMLASVNLPKRPFHLLSRLILHRLHSNEQTEELRGISSVSGVRMSLLVAYNVLLDLFMGCTSGGVLVKDGGEKAMMHFRTLDWSMPELRKALVQFEFVTEEGGAVVARTIGYVGFVGVLTGVRLGLSTSLNFRPYHNNGGHLLTDLKFLTHQLLVLVGFRPSISSHLRSFLIPSLPTPNLQSSPQSQKQTTPTPSTTPTLPDLASLLKDFPSTLTTAAYIILSDGTQTAVLEKDRKTARTLMSTEFITATNNDEVYETKDGNDNGNGNGNVDGEGNGERRKDSGAGEGGESEDIEQAHTHGHVALGMDPYYVKLDHLKTMITQYPIVNEQTHFVTIMAPHTGEIAWVRGFEEGEI
ncbi:beta subunit of N-acylethanolamine-hydrolyzing acid amidase-domain-containing protein, partial [Clohesyomyces aquaticus]